MEIKVTTTSTKTGMMDLVLGPSQAPGLLMEQNTIKVASNPVSRFIPGADGAVALYLVPTYNDIASLYFEDGRWMINSVFQAEPIATPSEFEADALPLSEETMKRVLSLVAVPG